MRAMGNVLVVAVLLFGVDLVRADTIRVALQGGEFQRVQAQYAAREFTEATHVQVSFVAGNPPDHLQKLIASRGRPSPFDVVYLDDKTQPIAIDADTVIKLDPNIVNNLERIYPEARQKDGFGPAMLFWAWGLLYNSKIFRDRGIAPPTSWSELWKPELAGKVGVFDITGSGGVDLVVKSAELSGGGVNNLQPGLERISKLKVSSFFTSANQLAQSMSAGDTWAAPLNNGRAWGMIDAGFPGVFIIPREGGYFHTTTIDVVKGTRHLKEAELYVNFVLSADAQLGQAHEIPFGPVNRLVGIEIMKEPALGRKIPLPGNAMMLNLSIPDWRPIFDNFPALVDAWNRTVKDAD